MTTKPHPSKSKPKLTEKVRKDRSVTGKPSEDANANSNTKSSFPQSQVEALLEELHNHSKGTGYLPDYSTAEEQNAYVEMMQAQGVYIPHYKEELSGAVGQIAHAVTAGLIRLRKIEREASNPERKLAAGRALADVTSLFLDWWPKDASKSVSSTILNLKKKSRGFQERWDEELHRKGRPMQRSRIDTICSNFIWEMHYYALDGEEFVISSFANSDGPQKGPGEWGTLVGQFVEETGLAKRMLKEPGRAAELLNTGKRRFVENYWRIVIDPMGKRHWKAWAANHKFEQPKSRLTQWMTPEEIKRKWPNWKPSYGSVRRNLKQLLMELLEAGTTHLGWY